MTIHAGANPTAASEHVGRLELHVTHVCNLACESCSHYSNHNHSGHLALDEADAWITAWRDRLTVGEFTLLGGEPTLHPELPMFVRLVRRHWPSARIMVISNGFFLDRQPDLPQALAEVGEATLCLSVHHDAPDYRRRLQPELDLADRWRADYGIAVEVWKSHENWTRRYRGFGETMQPFEDADPRASWDICPARTCRQLFEGKLWKCSPIAYLQLQRRKYALSSKWGPYLDYQPLAPDCSNDELSAFLEREHESICAMCPATRRPFAMPNPMRRSALHRVS